MNQSERNHITPEFILSKTFKTNCRLPNSKGCDLSLSAFLVDLDVIAVHPKTDCLTFWACDFGKNTSTAFFDGIKWVICAPHGGKQFLRIHPTGVYKHKRFQRISFFLMICPCWGCKVMWNKHWTTPSWRGYSLWDIMKIYPKTQKYIKRRRTQILRTAPLCLQISALSLETVQGIIYFSASLIVHLTTQVQELLSCGHKIHFQETHRISGSQ